MVGEQQNSSDKSRGTKAAVVRSTKDRRSGHGISEDLYGRIRTSRWDGKGYKKKTNSHMNHSDFQGVQCEAHSQNWVNIEQHSIRMYIT
jgi:hypothetical protein